MRHPLLVAATITLMSSLASAGSKPSPTAASLITDKLIQPLAAKDSEQSKFSRARLPPSERRARVLDQTPQKDKDGNSFFAFAIDVRRGWGKTESDDNWTKAAMTGCVYVDSGSVFIKRGNAIHPAAAALGKKTKAAPAGTCTAAPAEQVSMHWFNESKR